MALYATSKKPNDDNVKLADKRPKMNKIIVSNILNNILNYILNDN